jgi:hypothetical protein
VIPRMIAVDEHNAFARDLMRETIPAPEPDIVKA